MEALETLVSPKALFTDVLEQLPKTNLILEIGPGATPVAPLLADTREGSHVIAVELPRVMKLHRNQLDEWIHNYPSQRTWWFYAGDVRDLLQNRPHILETYCLFPTPIHDVLDYIDKVTEFTQKIEVVVELHPNNHTYPMYWQGRKNEFHTHIQDILNANGMDVYSSLLSFEEYEKHYPRTDFFEEIRPRANMSVLVIHGIRTIFF